MPVHEQTLAGFLDALAARVPAPGGGAAAALHLALAAALVAMVGRYSDEPKYDAHRDDISAAVQVADSLRSQALVLAADDEAAFSQVSAAYALPRGSDADKEQRRAAIATALAQAVDPPIHVVAAARRVLELAIGLAPIANRNLISDLAAAAEAAKAAAATGRVNIEVNLSGIRDEAVRQRCAESAALAEDLQNAADKLTVAIRAELMP